MKQIPHSPEAEKGVIGCIFFEPKTIEKVMQIITHEDFYDKKNALVYQASIELFTRHIPIDLLTVREFLDDRQRLEDVGWNEALISITESIFSLSNAVQYAQIIKQKSILRKFIKAGNDIFLSGYNEQANASELLEMVAKTYENLSLITETEGKVSKISDLVFSLHDDIEEAVEFGDKQRGYATGIPTLDKYTGWIQKWRTIILSAYSNTGKSALSYTIANSVLKQWGKVLYFSLEIPKEDLRDRLLSNFYKMPIQAFEKKSSLSSFDMSSYGEKELYIVSEMFAISDIERITKSIKPDIVFIDYVQLVKGEWNSEYEQMNDVARRIRKLSAENNCGIFYLSQVSNDGKQFKKWDVIPSKGSGELISVSNVALVLKEGEFDGKLELIIAKNRHGRKGIAIELTPDFRFSSFDDGGEISWGKR